MTTAHAATRRHLTEDAAISAAVRALLDDRGESVTALSYHTSISVASLYRKLAGDQSWKAADLGAVARHYGLQPGDLFLGSHVIGRPLSGPDGGGAVCAIRDSNPEPADSEHGPAYEFQGNRAGGPPPLAGWLRPIPGWGSPSRGVAAEDPSTQYDRAA